MTAMPRHLATLAPVERLPLLEDIAVCGSWALDTYRQCEFRCVYCITAAQGPSVPRYARDEVVPQLRHELTAIDPNARIAVGSLCDAYPRVELDEGVTRLAIEELIAQWRVFTIITKGTAILRDRALLASAPTARVRVSLCTVDEEALRRVDANAPTAAERIDVAHALHEAGVQVSISAAPWIPGVSDARALLDRVDPAIAVRFAPLNVVNAASASSPYARRFDQAQINAAYRLEFERVGRDERTTWVRPVPYAASEPEHHPFARLGGEN